MVFLSGVGKRPPQSLFLLFLLFPLFFIPPHLKINGRDTMLIWEILCWCPQSTTCMLIDVCESTNSRRSEEAELEDL